MISDIVSIISSAREVSGTKYLRNVTSYNPKSGKFVKSEDTRMHRGFKNATEDYVYES